MSWERCSLTATHYSKESIEKSVPVVWTILPLHRPLPCSEACWNKAVFLWWLAFSSGSCQGTCEKWGWGREVVYAVFLHWSKARENRCVFLLPIKRAGCLLVHQDQLRAEQTPPLGRMKDIRWLTICHHLAPKARDYKNKPLRMHC